jgi:outer membrane lipoprotein-sorting protein
MKQGLALFHRALVTGALLGGLSCAALAQTMPAIVPLPRPAPFPKEGVVQQAPVPPAAIPVPPAAVQPPPAPLPPVASVVPPAPPPAPPAPPAAPAVVTSRSGNAFSVAQRASLERINGYFNSVTNLVGNFVQVGPDGSRSEGKLFIMKPGKVRFEYDPPSPVELIADGNSVAVRDRKLATQDIYPLSQTPLRFLLTDKINLLRDANVVGIYQDELFVSVAIEEKHPITGTHRLLIMFGAQDFQLKQWTITDQQGYDTTVAVYNLDPSKKPDPMLFRINYERVLQ